MASWRTCFGHRNCVLRHREGGGEEGKRMSEGRQGKLRDSGGGDEES